MLHLLVISLADVGSCCRSPTQCACVPTDSLPEEDSEAAGSPGSVTTGLSWLRCPLRQTPPCQWAQDQGGSALSSSWFFPVLVTEVTRHKMFVTKIRIVPRITIVRCLAFVLPDFPELPVMGMCLGMTSHVEGFEHAARSVCASVSNVQWNSHSTRQSVCVVARRVPGT